MPLDPLPDAGSLLGIHAAETCEDDFLGGVVGFADADIWITATMGRSRLVSDAV